MNMQHAGFCWFFFSNLIQSSSCCCLKNSKFLKYDNQDSVQEIMTFCSFAQIINHN